MFSLGFEPWLLLKLILLNSTKTFINPENILTNIMELLR